MKCSDGMFYGGRKHTTTNYYFSFLNLGAVSRISKINLHLTFKASWSNGDGV